MEMIGPHSTRPGPRYRNHDGVCWAEDGAVFYEWDDGERDVLELPKARTRLTAFKEQTDLWEGKKDHGGPGVDRAYAAEMYRLMRKAMENLRDAIKDAEAQGDPTDPEIRVKKLVAFLRSRRANLVGDTSRVHSPAAVASAILMPVTYDRLPDYLPKPKTGVVYFDIPAIPRK